MVRLYVMLNSLKHKHRRFYNRKIALMQNINKAGIKFGAGSSAKFGILVAIATVLCGVCLVDISLSADTKDVARGVKLIEVVTHPSYDGMLSFPVPGRVLDVLVKVGQRVKKGQLLVQLDDRVELARLEQLKKESENVVMEKVRKAQKEQSGLELKRIKMLHEKRVATDTELEQAELDYKINGHSVELAEFELAQAGLKYKEMQQQIERMKIVAPCDGVVEELKVEDGESLEQAEDVIRLVRIDPLWVDIPVPLKIANTLKPGDTVKIYFDETQKDSGNGKVVHIAVVADAAVDARIVRVEILNSSSKPRPAGTRVWAEFSENVTAK